MTDVRDRRRGNALVMIGCGVLLLLGLFMGAGLLFMSRPSPPMRAGWQLPAERVDYQDPPTYTEQQDGAVSSLRQGVHRTLARTSSGDWLVVWPAVDGGSAGVAIGLGTPAPKSADSREITVVVGEKSHALSPSKEVALWVVTRDVVWSGELVRPLDRVALDARLEQMQEEGEPLRGLIFELIGLTRLERETPPK